LTFKALSNIFCQQEAKQKQNMRRRKHKKISAKLGLLFTFLIISLASISMSYSAWTDTITIEGTINTMDDFNYLNLKGYWTLNETFGTIAHDSSMYNNDGDVYGATWTSGQVNGALSFDGIDDYVDCGNHESLDFSTCDFTVMTWVYIIDQWTGGAGSNLNVSAILDKGTGHRIDGYGLHFSGNYMKIRFSTDGDGTEPGDTYRKDLWNKDPLNYNQWYHVVAVRESGVKYLYIDGVQQPTTQADVREISDLSRHLVFGKHDRDSGGWFNGLIDEVKIYSCALDDSEIWDEYHAGL